jgi:outer membrane autotransporter protein
MWWSFFAPVDCRRFVTIVQTIDQLGAGSRPRLPLGARVKGYREAPAGRSTGIPIRLKKACNRIVLMALLSSCWLLSQAAAGDGVSTLYWDNVGPGSPNGAWDISSSFWSQDPFGTPPRTSWSNGSNAVFSATSLNATGDFTVTLAANVIVGNLTYTGGGLGTVVQIAAGPATNTITIAASPMLVMVDPFTTLVVAAKIAGAGGSLVLQGPSALPTIRTLEALPGFPGGTLILTGANSYTGGTTILSGTLQLGNGNATGSIIGAVVNEDTFNIINANTAEITQITNNFGTTNFFNTSTAANAEIINNGGFTAFLNASTAGAAAITNNGGSTEFFDSSTARNANITTNGGGFAEFFDTSTAAHAILINNSGGETEFNITSTAGFATIINNQNGFTNFKNASTAANAAITNNGGVTEFFDASTAANSTITNNSGGLTIFFNMSTGGNARFIANAGGIFDISHLSSLGMTAGSIEGAGTYQLGSKALTVGLNNLSTIVSGTIIDGGPGIGTGGSLIKVGTGTLTLSGANTYTGGTVLNAGTLTVNGAQALGLGTLVVNGGTLNADPQPINVKGNYDQNAAGTLQLHLAGANPGQYDSLNVGGKAALGGTLQLIALGYQPKISDQLTLVIASGGISGKFANFLDPFSPAINPELVYGPNSVVLEFESDFASLAETPNERAAASLLDRIALNPRAAELINFLFNEPLSNLRGDLERISPDAVASFYEISFSNANIQKLNLEGRMDDIHNGSNGFSSNLKMIGATVNLEDRADADGKSSKAVVEPVLQHAPENRWGVWVTGFGDFVDVNSDGNGQGYDFTTGGVSLGIDYRITDELAVGAMGEYSHTWTSLNPSGHIDVDSGRGGLYATWYHQGIYLNGAIYGGHNTYDSSRTGLGGLATGGTEGAEWSTFVSGGYDFHFGPLTAGPLASLQYTDVHIDGFSEKGSLAPMAIHSGSAESLRSDVGFRIFYQWQIGRIVFEPSLKAAWEHEYKYAALPITAGFAEFPSPSATFFGPAEGHDSAIISAGISGQLTPAITVYVNYDGQLGRDNYDANGVTGGLRFGF